MSETAESLYWCGFRECLQFFPLLFPPFLPFPSFAFLMVSTQYHVPTSTLHRKVPCTASYYVPQNSPFLQYIYIYMWLNRVNSLNRLNRLIDFWNANTKIKKSKKKQEKQEFFWHKVNNVFIFYLYLYQQQQTTTTN